MLCTGNWPPNAEYRHREFPLQRLSCRHCWARCSSPSSRCPPGAPCAAASAWWMIPAIAKSTRLPSPSPAALPCSRGIVVPLVAGRCRRPLELPPPPPRPRRAGLRLLPPRHGTRRFHPRRLRHRPPRLLSTTNTNCAPRSNSPGNSPWRCSWPVAAPASRCLSTACCSATPSPILWILTVINAFNFMDNMNGLCAGPRRHQFLVLRADCHDGRPISRRAPCSAHLRRVARFSAL